MRLRSFFLLPLLVTLRDRVEAVCVSYNEAMANNGSCTQSRPGCCTLFPDSAGTFDDGAGGCDCCCSSCADNEAFCAQDTPQDFCTPGDCCYTTTMDVSNAVFDPQVADVVKFFLASMGTTYTATIMEIIEEDDGTKRYKIEYVDETTHSVQRTTAIDALSPMPFDPQVGDVAKFFNEYAGEGGTTYTATIMFKTNQEEDDGTLNMKYEIEYVDETTHTVRRTTTIDYLSPMPIQVNNTKFCECHLQDACADAVCTTVPPSDFSCAPTSPCATLFPNSPEGCMVGHACSSAASCGSSSDPYCHYSCLDAPADAVSTTGKTCQLVCQAGNPGHGGDHGGDHGQGGGVSCPTGCVPRRSRARRLLFASVPRECGPGCEPA